ncbi:MAG: hypothetical protein JSW60_06020 [Thermoplasmatales archaeon]|nr:MAG: hypothetical protein JSW60_06020 [Thermoplasmatales archaeon]
MRKILPLLVISILVLSVFGASAISNPNNNIRNINVIDYFELDTFVSEQILWTNSNIGKTSPGWSTTEVVTKDSIIDSWFPSLFVDSIGTVHIVWNEPTNYGGSGLDDDIFYKSKPKGGSWTPTEVVSTESTKDSWLPSITIDSNDTIHVTWEDWTDIEGSGNDWDIFYKSKPKGGSWTPTEVISIESTEDTSVSSLAVDFKGTVHVTWIDSTNFNGAGSDVDIFYKCKPIGGSWTPAEVISIESTENSWNPCLAVDSTGAVHVTWEDLTNIAGSGLDWDIFYRYKESSGNWSTIETVSTESTLDSWFSSLAVDSTGTIHVAWQDFTDFGGSGIDSDIFYKYKPFGESWITSDIVSSESTSDSGKPSLALDSTGTVHVAWEDVTDFGGSGNDCDIFYKSKQSDGNWGTTEVVSTESTYISWFATLDIDTTKTVHVAWADATDIEKLGNRINDLDIFYKYKPGESGPHLEIHSISGGFGINAEIKNFGDTDASVINWIINLDGRLIFYGKENTGTIENLSAGESEIIKSGLILGIGKATITLSAECFEGSSDEKSTSGFLILPLVVGVR